jgi:phosphoribosylformylglycinamidine cyclo-ligase
VGAAERGDLLPRAVSPGDAVIGLASSGVHSNGFSLVRRIVEASGLGWDASAPFASGASLATALMSPTRIYVKSLLALHRAGLLKAAAHITGGGLPGNLPRVLPEGLGARLELASWPRPEVFDWLAGLGVEEDEMRRVFNLGLGYVVVVPTGEADEAIRISAAAGHAAYRVGEIVSGSGVELV